jgi:hypothetical protein
MSGIKDCDLYKAIQVFGIPEATVIARALKTGPLWTTDPSFSGKYNLLEEMVKTELIFFRDNKYYLTGFGASIMESLDAIKEKVS